MLKTEDLTFTYSQADEVPVAVLNGINLEIHKGEFVAILGHNGSGKSTLAKHFNGILLPSGGTVYALGYDTKNEDTLIKIRQGVGLVFQNPDNQIVAGVVEEDVAFAPENLGIAPPEIRKRVDDALKTVRMSEYALHSPSQLSGGQKQRVAIAGIIAMKPRCIVLDEPTAMLDPRGRKEVLETVERLNKEDGITIVMITHYMNEAVNADRVIVMNEGEIVLNAPPKEVFTQVELMRSMRLDVPMETELFYELQKEGIDIKPDVMSIDKCVDVLMDLLK